LKWRGSRNPVTRMIAPMSTPGRVPATTAQTSGQIIRPSRQ
jgi:hypothetical protein